MFRDVRLVFQRLFRPDKNKKSGGSIEYSPSVGFFFFFCGHVSDFDVQLCTHIFFCSVLFCSVRFVFGSAKKYFVVHVCPLRFWDTCHGLPTSFCALLLELSGFM